MPGSCRDMKSRVRRQIRSDLYAAQGGLCSICGRMMEFDGEFAYSQDYATIDHIVAISLGGSNRRENLRLTHRSCNEEKGKQENPDNRETQMKRWPIFIPI